VTKASLAKASSNLNPNPMVESEHHFCCNLAGRLKENFEDAEFVTFVLKHLPAAVFRDGNRMYFNKQDLSQLRLYYAHFFGSTF